MTEHCYGLGLCKYYHICCIYNNAKEKENYSEYDIIQKILKICESDMYLLVLIPNYKHTYDQIYLIKKWIRALYRELVLFLRSKKRFWYIPENESEQPVLGWNTSYTINFEVCGFRLLLFIIIVDYPLTSNLKVR